MCFTTTSSLSGGILTHRNTFTTQTSQDISPHRNIIKVSWKREDSPHQKGVLPHSDLYKTQTSESISMRREDEDCLKTPSILLRSEDSFTTPCRNSFVKVKMSEDNSSRYRDSLTTQTSENVPPHHDTFARSTTNKNDVSPLYRDCLTRVTNNRNVSSTHREAFTRSTANKTDVSSSYSDCFKTISEDISSLHRNSSTKVTKNKNVSSYNDSLKTVTNSEDISSSHHNSSKKASYHASFQRSGDTSLHFDSFRARGDVSSQSERATNKSSSLNNYFTDSDNSQTLTTNKSVSPTFHGCFTRDKTSKDVPPNYECFAKDKHASTPNYNKKHCFTTNGDISSSNGHTFTVESKSREALPTYRDHCSVKNNASGDFSSRNEEIFTATGGVFFGKKQRRFIIA